MKIAMVVNVYTPKEQNLLINYRTIYILPVISKVLEHLIYKDYYMYAVSKMNAIANIAFGPVILQYMQLVNVGLAFLIISKRMSTP